MGRLSLLFTTVLTFLGDAVLLCGAVLSILLVVMSSSSGGVAFFSLSLSGAALGDPTFQSFFGVVVPFFGGIGLSSFCWRCCHFLLLSGVAALLLLGLFLLWVVHFLLGCAAWFPSSCGLLRPPLGFPLLVRMVLVSPFLVLVALLALPPSVFLLGVVLLFTFRNLR